MKKSFFLIYVTTLLQITCNAQFFTKVNTDPIVTTIGDSRSVNWIDVNNDNLPDCFISNGPSGGQNNVLFINNGSGGFYLNSTDTISKDNMPSDGATFADYNNDGNVDCFVANWYNENNLMYLNSNVGDFIRIGSGIPSIDASYSETASWGDYDGDGFVDLYVTNSAGTKKNFLYRNNQDGTFTKILTGLHVIDSKESRCVNWSDIDNDGDLDLFVTNESNQNENLYRNDGSGTFTSVISGSLLNNGGNTMSASWGDYDNDGDLDVFLANNQGFNSLFRNDGSLLFTKIISDTVANTPSRSFSSAWSDVDNDGDLDLFVTNSYGTLEKQLNFFYLNNGSGGFIRNSTDIIANDSAWSYGCAFADYDNDGFEDLAVATCRFGGVDQFNMLYHNNTNSNNWVTLKLVGTLSNKYAIGTKIRVKAIIGGNPVWQMREITAQSAYCGQNDIRAHFGLGDASTIDSIIIEWPLGIVERYTNINSNQFLQYIEGATVAALDDLKNISPSLIIFPNPTNDYLTIEFSNEYFDVGDEILLYDLNGRLITKVKAGQSYEITLDLKKYNLISGEYLVIIKGKKQYGVNKIIIGN